MLSNLKSSIRIIHDWARPYCAKCGTRSFPHKHCELCGSICKMNQSEKLKVNYTKYLKIDDEVNKAEYICEKCFDSRELTKCAKTGYVFLRSKDQMQKFYNSQIWRNLSPHHPSSQISGSLSPEGFTIIEQEHQELQSRYANWVGCTKQEFFREHHIKKEIKLIRTKGEHDDPAQAESELKWHCLQIGGNGLIKFFSDKHIEYHEEEYIAGYGHKGNPYYKTRRWTTAYFSAHAVAVIAELKEPSSRSQKNERSKNNKFPYKAAVEGNSDAQYQLGDLYYNGEGQFSHSYYDAAFWYKKSAYQGNHWGQFNLAKCYQYGHGVEQSFKKAKEWYAKAADQGNEWAQKAYDSL